MPSLAGVPELLLPLAGLGLAGIVLCSIAEKVVPVVPSYLLLVGLGLLAVDDTHDLLLTIAASTLGSTLGSLLWYLLGRRLGSERGEALVERYGRLVFLRVALYRRSMNAYSERRFWVTAAAQTIPAARVYLAFPAGVLGLPVAGFATATFLGALAWNAPLIVLGYALQGQTVDPTVAAAWTTAALLALEAVVFALRRPWARAAGATTSPARSSLLKKLA